MFTRLLLTGTLCGLVCRSDRFSTGSFGLNGSRECRFGTNSGCDCHFSGDNLIIQKERFLYIVVSYRLVFTRLLLIGTLCGLVCRGVRFSTGSFGLNGSRELMYVRNKQWLRLSLLRRQSDHTEGEVPVDCCQLQVGVHTAPSHWYSMWPGLSWCSVLHWELRIEWQQGISVR